jgi:cytochrome c-type biogenesis protein CcmH
MAIALPALAFSLYAVFGNPLTIGEGPAAATASTGNAGIVPPRRDELLRHLASNPRDGRGWVLLARMDFETDRYADAAASYEKALATSPKIAADSGVWCEYADALGMAQGGTLAGRPRVLVMRALTLDPAHPKALEMAGSAAYEQQDFAAAAQYWQQLLAQLPAPSVRHRELTAAIARAERLTLASSGGSGASK